MARIFVGVAWPYANGPFHIGHLAGAYLPGDIFARFHRLKGDEVLMVSGSDMHGTPILVTAEKEGTTAEAIARRYDEVIRTSFEQLGFSFDLFTNTHTIVHERTTQELFLQLLEHRFIVRKTEENAFCPTHGRFLPDRYLVGTCPHCGFDSARGDECDNCGRVIEPRTLKNPRCILDGTPAEFRPSEHFYLSLDLLAPQLTEFLSDKAYWRPSVLGVAKNFLTEGLRATPITRDLDWGVKIPLDGYDTKRFYVWFDAVIGYLSASREWAIRANQPDAWKRFWSADEAVRQYYFIGKDNVFHHTIVWPGILLGVGGLQLPYDVPANAWLLVGGHKLSRSRSRATDVFIPSLLAHYDPDVIRFYAAQQAPQNHDTEFDWDEFHKLAEEVLANQWGNLVQRVLVLTRDRIEGRIPEPPGSWDPRDKSGVGPRLHEAHRRITAELEAVRLKEALDLIFAEIREGNRRFHDAKPWQGADEPRRRILYESIWLIRAAATWLQPYLPFSSSKIFQMLGYARPPTVGEWDRALEPPIPGQALGEIRPLFPKEAIGVTEPLPVPSPVSVAAPTSGSVGVPSSSEPAPLNAVAAVVRSVADHPTADRLYVLQLDIGGPELRTVVAGLKGTYKPADLDGARVVLLANLEPRTIRKVTSNGMVLAGDLNGKAVLLHPPPGVAAGTTTDGGSRDARTIRYDEFEGSPLVVGTVVGPGGGGVRVDVGGREVTAPGNWESGARVVVQLVRTGGSEGIILSFGPGLAVEPQAALPGGSRIR